MKTVRTLPDGTLLRQSMRPNNTNLNEDLGMVEYVFSDKTGTLTCNEMVLARFYIHGYEFNELDHPGCVDAALSRGVIPVHAMTDEYVGATEKSIDASTREHMILFMRVLSLAHDTLPTRDDHGEILYESSSPGTSCAHVAG